MKMLIAIYLVLLVGFAGWTIYKFKKDPDVKGKELWNFVLMAVLGIAPMVFSLVSPEKTVEVAFPDIEKYTKKIESLETDNSNQKETIAELSQKDTTNKKKIDSLGKKNFADLKKSDLIVDGLEVNKGTSSLAIIDGENYYHGNVVNQLIDNKIQYDEEQDKIFVGNEDVNKVDKLKFSDIDKILYDGKSYRKYDEEENESFSVAGNDHERGFTITSSSYSKDNYVLINLNGKYKKMSFDVGKIQDSYGDIQDAKMKIYLDGNESRSETISAETPSTAYEVEVQNAKSLKIALTDSNDTFGFYNIVFTK